MEKDARVDKTFNSSSGSNTTRSSSYSPSPSSRSSFSQPSQITLPNTTPEDEHDLVCIGFGPASLAIAVALHDKLESGAAQDSHLLGPKVKFLERQCSFGWHAGMLLPGTKMQISFIKDLATLRDPRSKFTFLNYLKCQGRLVQFSNLDTFLPLRIEFEDYLKWCAEHFRNAVKYSQEVVRVRPVKLEGDGKYNALEVTTRDTASGQSHTWKGRKVVIAVGGRPSIPPTFRDHEDRVIHSSEYKLKISELLPSPDMPYRIVVVGGGQSGAEVFSDLQSRFPKAHTKLVIRDTALRPSDDSPFVNEVFNPEAVDAFYDSAPESRTNQLQTNKATNYSVVRIGLLERIYEEMYHQRISQPDPDCWQHQILPSKSVTRVIKNKSQRLNLTLKDLSPAAAETEDLVNVDAVILATGYVRDVHDDMLRDCQIINGSPSKQWTANRDYQVRLNQEMVEENVGIYLQGCNEETHGLSDTLLSILATRSGEIVDSMNLSLKARQGGCT